MQRKEHAKDYLVDYAQNEVSDSWLKILIYETVLSNGNIDAKKLDELYSMLVNDASIEEPTLISSREPQNCELKFQTLKHISGVSALTNNQTIKFCDNVTIMYGLNGSGKSSYFRIMNEIVGGNQKKEILPNIYSDSPEPISVEFFIRLGISTEIFDGIIRKERMQTWQIPKYLIRPI